MFPGLLLVAVLAEPPPVTAGDVQLAASASICAWDGTRQAALKEIEREKRLSRIGGVLDLGRVAYWQRVVGNVEDHNREQLELLKAKTKKPLPCAQQLVAKAATCIRVQHGGDGHVMSTWSDDAPCWDEDLFPVRRLLYGETAPSPGDP